MIIGMEMTWMRIWRLLTTVLITANSSAFMSRWENGDHLSSSTS